jgi:hypothetical protein
VQAALRRATRWSPSYDNYRVQRAILRNAHARCRTSSARPAVCGYAARRSRPRAPAPGGPDNLRPRSHDLLETSPSGPMPRRASSTRFASRWGSRRRRCARRALLRSRVDHGQGLSTAASALVHTICGARALEVPKTRPVAKYSARRADNSLTAQVSQSGATREPDRPQAISPHSPGAVREVAAAPPRRLSSAVAVWA